MRHKSGGYYHILLRFGVILWRNRRCTPYLSILNTTLPVNFRKYYLNLGSEPKSIVPYKEINISIDVSFKFGALLTGIGSKYYHWVDSFLDKIDKDFSSEKFFEAIGWNSALTVIDHLQRQSSSPNRSRKSVGDEC